MSLPGAVQDCPVGALWPHINKSSLCGCRGGNCRTALHAPDCLAPLTVPVSFRGCGVPRAYICFFLFYLHIFIMGTCLRRCSGRGLANNGPLTSALLLQLSAHRGMINSIHRGDGGGSILNARTSGGTCLRVRLERGGDVNGVFLA